MTLYGYIRTSKDDLNPENQRRGLWAAGVQDENIYSDAGVSGASGVASRNGWRYLDQRLTRGDTLVVAALDRVGRRAVDIMGAVYALHGRGVRIRSLADSDGGWVAGLDADPDSADWAMGSLLAGMAAYVAQLERDHTKRRTKAGLERAKAEGKTLGRPRTLTDAAVTAIRQEHKEGQNISDLARRWNVSRRTISRLLVDPSEPSP